MHSHYDLGLLVLFCFELIKEAVMKPTTLNHNVGICKVDSQEGRLCYVGWSEILARQIA